MPGLETLSCVRRSTFERAAIVGASQAPLLTCTSAHFKHTIMCHQGSGSCQVRLVEGTAHQGYPLQRAAGGWLAPLGRVAAWRDFAQGPTHRARPTQHPLTTLMAGQRRPTAEASVGYTGGGTIASRPRVVTTCTQPRRELKSGWDIAVAA